jgi:hypothetical protein
MLDTSKETLTTFEHTTKKSKDKKNLRVGGRQVSWLGVQRVSITHVHTYTHNTMCDSHACMYSTVHVRTNAEINMGRKQWFHC